MVGMNSSLSLISFSWASGSRRNFPALCTTSMYFPISGILTKRSMLAIFRMQQTHFFRKAGVCLPKAKSSSSSIAGDEKRTQKSLSTFLYKQFKNMPYPQQADLTTFVLCKKQKKTNTRFFCVGFSLKQAQQNFFSPFNYMRNANRNIFLCLWKGWQKRQ